MSLLSFFFLSKFFYRKLQIGGATPCLAIKAKICWLCNWICKFPMPKSSKKKKDKAADFSVWIPHFLERNLYRPHSDRKRSWSLERANKLRAMPLTPHLKLDVNLTALSLSFFNWLSISLAINLPTQSITSNKNADLPSTKRRLTFDDLLAHLKHYSPGTRKGAFIFRLSIYVWRWFQMRF